MDEIVQYFVINKELNMSRGKTAAQVAHVATKIALKYQNDENFYNWFEGSQTKIVLEAKEKELHKLIQMGFEYVLDEGRTEITPNSLTVVGLNPMNKEEAKKYIKRFQLCK